MKNELIQAPVLFIVFNRPDTTKIVFEAIKKSKPKKLYIYADGPRNGNEEDKSKCSEVRKIFDDVGWDCDLKKQFNEINMGCGPGPAAAISWIFKYEDRAVILEDDCVPSQSFFPYCDELLEQYKYDNRVWMVSGNNYNEEKSLKYEDYFFSRYGHTWGWATWKRSWKHFDLETKSWNVFKKEARIYDAFPTKKEAILFEKKYNTIFCDRSKREHIWDFQFNYLIRSNGGLCIIPRKNLVKNIGFIGTHSQKKNLFQDRSFDPNYKIIKHPRFILEYRDYDWYHFNHHWLKILKVPYYKRVFKKLKRILFT